jgi:hypothetical protein
MTDEDGVRIKEQAILDLGLLYKKTKKAKGICLFSKANQY